MDKSTSHTSQTLISLFKYQVEKYPDKIALVSDSEEISYHELYIRSRELSFELNAFSNGDSSLVAIRGQRSPEFIVAILGILMTGAAYVPIDPLYPLKTQEYILEDALPDILIDIKANKKSSWKISKLISKNNTEKSLSSTPHNLAYVLYTSGLTGNPKGIMIEQKSICSRINALQHIYAITENDIVLHNSPYGFDGSVEEIFLTLISGCKLIIAPPGNTYDILNQSMEYIDRYKVTTLYLMPTLWGHFSNIIQATAQKNTCRSLKRLIGGGEVLRPHILQKLQKLLDIDYYYIYGPTENTVNSSIWKCNGKINPYIVPVGIPLPQTKINLLDHTLTPVKLGDIGEIYISGVGLAQGYVNKKELTKKRFIRFKDKERLYNTRDLGRLNSAGLLEYVGRKECDKLSYEDYYNIAQAQSFLCSQDIVEEAMLEVENDGKIEAYISLHRKETANLSHKKLEQIFRTQLENYEVSINQFIFVPHFKYTPAGKIDINAMKKI